MMEKLAPYRVFTSSSLKLIAVITMLIDHFGATVMPASAGRPRCQPMPDIGPPRLPEQT